MKLGKRIFISNTLMVLLSLVVLLAIGSGMINMYHKTSIKNNQLNPNILKVESILKQNQGINRDWSELSLSLEEYNYRLCVSKDDSLIYCNIRHPDDDIKAFLQTLNLSADQLNVFFGDGVTTIGQLISFEDESYAVVAVNYSIYNQLIGVDRDYFEKFLITFLLVGLAAIAVLLIISQLLTKRLVKHIMTPIHQLTESAKRIEEGDLSTPIINTGKDEFETVCISFNQMQFHLKEEQDKNAAYEKARTDMISGISHDLRTPLTSVKGYIKGLQDGIANTPEKQAQYLSIAYKKASDMDVLLQRLFYFSKLETGNLPFFPVETDLGKFTQKFALDIQDDLKHKNASIRVEISGSNHLVRIDTEQMRQVLANLVENALKYAGVVPIELSMKVTQENENEVLCFTDNGSGVSPEKLPHLFEQFYRGDESRNNQNSDGNGLGLYIVKYIIEAQGGTVIAENDQGLKFTMTFPSAKGGSA
ncbi:HAMP domain-containing sensor histidine kinase [Niallia sp.]|uniref:HAMP domain-containing sensor histidine kinase n=1 Tax=Niallia sp. TaxID=2837523 RepID=UPI002896EA5E|nr:HAMP domain-containing sensor histidine kinase [Niallia sp.]